MTSLQHILIIAFSVLVSVTGKVYAQPKLLQAKRQPNVVIIYTDDQGTLDLYSYGAKDLVTPNLDRLARNGTRFSQFYSTSPICSPSRASLLTGRYPQRAGLVDNASGAYGGGGMPGSQYTLAELFKENGYKTAHIGKWHVGYSPETMPNQQGFDYSYGFMGGCIDNYSHFFYWSGPNRHDLWQNGQEIYEPGQYFPDLMVREAGQFIERNKDKPFFLYFALNMPHYPLQGEKKWFATYKHLPSPRNMYAAAISTMDEKIGLLLSKLDELRLTENTIIVFQADQGHSEEERAFGGGGFAGPFRGSKFSVFEGGIRVPAIISWPGKIPNNSVCEEFGSNMDWYPTLAEYCEIKLPDRKIDGRSLTKIIASKQAQSPHQSFFWQSQGEKGNPQWAVREGNWKLLHSPLQTKPGDVDPQSFMLIDLKADPSESKNLSVQYPEIVERLTQKYKTWITEVKEQ